MLLRTFRVLTLAVTCLVIAAGCNRSNTADVTQAKAEAEAARAEAQAAKAELGKALEEAKSARAEAQAAKAELVKLKAEAAQATAPKVDPDRRAAEWALKAGARVHAFVAGKGKDIKSMAEVRDTPFRVLQIQCANNPLVDDAGLENLSGLSELTHLALAGCKITGSGLKHLAACRSLLSLNLERSPIEDPGVEHLTRLPALNQLWLMNTKVTDGAAKYLAQIKTLGDLGLDDTQVSDATLVQLEALPNLHHLAIRRTKVTDAGLTRFQAARPKVKV